MSSGKELQEMEVGTTPSKTKANAAASPGDALPTAGSNAAGVSTPGNSAQVEDLGGPDPSNYKPDDDSAKLKTPGKTLKQVKDVVNKKASAGDAAATSATKVSVPEEVEATEDEVVSEEMGMKKPYVFKCTSCISAFNTKHEVDEHIFKVHKWNISGVNSNHTV